MTILVVAVSARMVAELAVADGYAVTAFDRFGDVDLRAIAAGATAPDNDALAELSAGCAAEAIVYGGGFENRPDLVARLADGRELLGTAPEALLTARDPWVVSAAARAAGARAPETRAGLAAPEPPGPDPWLRKPRRGGGGRGVRRWTGGRLDPGEILQRWIGGLSCSAVAIGDGQRAVVLGLTEQLHRRGFQWTGNVTPPRLPDSEHEELHGRLSAVATETARRCGVRGAFSVDAIWDGRHAWVLEVNPRPTAGLELFGPGAFSAHVDGVRGVGLPTPGAPPATPVARCKLVLFADRALRAPDPSWWPASLVRDVPHESEAIPRGAPVCTLVSATAGPGELAELGGRLLTALPEAVLAGD